MKTVLKYALYLRDFDLTSLQKNCRHSHGRNKWNPLCIYIYYLFAEVFVHVFVHCSPFFRFFFLVITYSYLIWCIPAGNGFLWFVLLITCHILLYVSWLESTYIWANWVGYIYSWFLLNRNGRYWYLKQLETFFINQLLSCFYLPYCSLNTF